MSIFLRRWPDALWPSENSIESHMVSYCSAIKTDILHKQTVTIFIYNKKIYCLQSSKVCDLYMHVAVGTLRVASHAIFVQYFSWPYLSFKSEIKLPYFQKKYVTFKPLQILI